MSISTTQDSKTVWGVFVGDNGNQIEIFNSSKGPFPPTPGMTGTIAIGWPKIGDMNMFKDNYSDFVDKFRIVYHYETEQVFKTKANMVWYFAHTMKIGDWVICPSSAFGLLLVGEIIGDYKSDFENESKLYGKKRVDFVHLREVYWQYVIKDTDPQYKQLHRIGQLTVSRPNITFDNLQDILGGR